MAIPSDSTSRRYINHIRLFLDGGGDPNHCDQFNNTMLHLLAKERDGFVIEELVSAGADVNSVNFLEQTPLHIAVIHRNRSMINTLIRFGALVNTQDCKKNSVLHSAINACAMDKDWNCVNPFCPHRPPDVDIINRLLEHEGTDLNVRNSQGCTPLLWAVKDRNLDVVKALLTKSADANIGNKYLETPLHAALSYPNPNLQIARELLIHKASITCIDINCHTPLDRVLKREGDHESKELGMELVKLAVFYCTDKNVMIAASQMDEYFRIFSERCSEEKYKLQGEIIGDKSLYELIFQRLKDRSLAPLESEIVNNIFNLLKSGDYKIYDDVVRKCICNSGI